MNYRSVADLNSDIKSMIPKLPDDLDLIVGIPRSGLLTAMLLGLHLNLPVTDVNGLIEGRVIQAGNRLDSELLTDLSEARNILVIDDSVLSGGQIKEVKMKLESVGNSPQINYAAVYSSLQGHKYVDYYYEIVESPRIFEWNLMHHSLLSNSCVDIDGVLCRDPTSQENDDGEEYKEFLINVEPRYIPTKKIGWLVTCRLEKYRKLTESWLAKHNIKYNHLIMMDLPDKKTRVRLGNHASFKSDVYKSTEAVLFIESSYQQARDIARRVGRPVFCTEIGEMINPGFMAKNLDRGNRFINDVISNPAKAIRKPVRFLKNRVRKFVLKATQKIKAWEKNTDG